MYRPCTDSTHTHTQPFYSSLDFVQDNPGQPVPEGTSFWYKLTRIYCSKRQWVAVVLARPYANLHLAQSVNHASTHHCFYRWDALPATQPTAIKLAEQSGNLAPPGDYDWMVRQVPIQHMILISPKLHRDHICHLNVMDTALLQDYRKITYPMSIWLRGGGSFSIVIQPTPVKFDGNIEWWLENNTVAAGFLIFLPAAKG